MQKTLLRLEIKADLLRFVQNVAKGVIERVTTLQANSDTVVNTVVRNTDLLAGSFILQVAGCDAEVVISPAA